jgi:hypothetical protein
MPRKVVVILLEDRYGVRFVYRRSVLVNVLLFVGFPAYSCVIQTVCMEDTTLLGSA